jgi:hypothetical protein
LIDPHSGIARDENVSDEGIPNLGIQQGEHGLKLEKKFIR